MTAAAVGECGPHARTRTRRRAGTHGPGRPAEARTRTPAIGAHSSAHTLPIPARRGRRLAAARLPADSAPGRPAAARIPQAPPGAGKARPAAPVPPHPVHPPRSQNPRPWGLRTPSSRAGQGSAGPASESKMKPPPVAAAFLRDSLTPPPLGATGPYSP